MKNKIVLVPPFGMTFEQTTTEWCGFFADGIARNVAFLIERELNKAGYEFVDQSYSGDDVCAVIHYSGISFEVLKKHPEWIHIYYMMEPDIIIPYNELGGLKRLSCLMDYCISLYPDATDPECGLIGTPGFTYNFDVAFAAPALSERQFLMTMTNSFLDIDSRYELYSERRRITDWFAQNAPDQFRFWGSRVPEKYQNTKCYAGVAECKLSCMSQGKFGLCLENAMGKSGYISEKLFDTMFSGCVPIYWGLENITDYVPEDCFIDYRKYRSPEALYRRISQMSDEEIEGYRERIRKWLASDAKDVFSYERFVEIVLDCIASGKRAHPTARDYQWLHSQLSPNIALRFKRIYQAAGPMKTGKRIVRSAVRRIREKLKSAD